MAADAALDFASSRPHTTPALLAAGAEAHPDRELVIADDGTATYGEVALRAAVFAQQLTAQGIAPGDRIGVLLANGIRWCTAALGAHAAGLCVVPLNTWYREAELEEVVRRASLRLVVTEGVVFGEDVAGPLQRIAARTTGFAGGLLWPRDEALPPALEPVTIPDPVSALRSAPVREADDALLLFTSGSSAAPKAVRLTQRGVVETGHAVGERQGVVDGDRFFLPSPLFFVFGCSNALPNAMTHGGTLCTMDRFEPKAALALIERERCTVYYGVAPVTRALAACEDLAARDISTLRTGTANATPDDLRLAMEVLGVKEVCNAYGMTEGHGHSTITHHTDPPEIRMHTQGTVLPTQELRIVRADRAPVGVDEPGAIQLRGTIMPGYLDADDLNASVFDADGWFTTGDVGAFDGDGNLRFVGRSHEMMRVKGINISPAEVEQLLLRHAGVDEAFVFGIDVDGGEQEVGAVLVSTVAAGERPALVDEVVAWARTQVSTFKIPARLWVITGADLPLTATGKVSKRLLAQAAADGKL